MRKEVESTPAGERSKMFEFIKMMNPTGVKVLKEERTATGATLTAEGMDSMEKGKKANGKIEPPWYLRRSATTEGPVFRPARDRRFENRGSVKTAESPR